MSAAQLPEPTQPELIWVRNLAGEPRIRWNRVAGYIVETFGVNLVCAAGVSWFANTPFRYAIVLVMSCGLLSYLTIAVELQRQQVLAGCWRPRLSLAACLSLLTIAGIGFAILGNELRATQQAHAANMQLKAELDQVIGEGQAYIGSVHGSNVTCDIKRRDFSDADLAEVIRLASRRGRNDCQLSTLFLEPTSITSTGVEQLAACRQLTLLALPAMPLSDEAIAAIASNPDLQHLMVDEKQLTPAQLAHLRRALPRVRLNGKTWTDRKL